MDTLCIYFFSFLFFVLCILNNAGQKYFWPCSSFVLHCMHLHIFIYYRIKSRGPCSVGRGMHSPQMVLEELLAWHWLTAEHNRNITNEKSINTVLSQHFMCFTFHDCSSLFKWTYISGCLLCMTPAITAVFFVAVVFFSYNSLWCK